MATPRRSRDSRAVLIAMSEPEMTPRHGEAAVASSRGDPVRGVLVVDAAEVGRSRDEEEPRRDLEDRREDSERSGTQTGGLDSQDPEGRRVSDSDSVELGVERRGGRATVDPHPFFADRSRDPRVAGDSLRISSTHITSVSNDSIDILVFLHSMIWCIQRMFQHRVYSVGGRCLRDCRLMSPP